jgi:hypothetical protein
MLHPSIGVCARSTSRFITASAPLAAQQNEHNYDHKMVTARLSQSRGKFPWRFVRLAMLRRGQRRTDPRMAAAL